MGICSIRSVFSCWWNWGRVARRENKLARVEKHPKWRQIVQTGAPLLTRALLKQRVVFELINRQRASNNKQQLKAASNQMALQKREIQMGEIFHASTAALKHKVKHMSSLNQSNYRNPTPPPPLAKLNHLNRL